MAIAIMTPPYAAFYDSNGDPLSGGKLYTYLAGTTTPRATYTDQGGLTPNANPVILDSAGRAEVWLDDSAAYKFTLNTSADVLVRTTDNVRPFVTAGNTIGEYSSSSIATGAAVSLTTGVAANVTSITLAAGDWDITTRTNYKFGAATSYTLLSTGSSGTSAAFGAGEVSNVVTPATVPGNAEDITVTTIPFRASIAVPTTYYLVARGTFTVSTLAAYGIIRARRAAA